MGISVIFEGNIEPQFAGWIMHFIPDVQFGFVPGCGTNHGQYGAAVVFVIQSCLETKGPDKKRGEGILIPLDVAGAFDRCWWARMKRRLKKKGMRMRDNYGVEFNTCGIVPLTDTSGPVTAQRHEPSVGWVALRCTLAPLPCLITTITTIATYCVRVRVGCTGGGLVCGLRTG